MTQVSARSIWISTKGKQTVTASESKCEFHSHQFAESFLKNFIVKTVNRHFSHTTTNKVTSLSIIHNHHVSSSNFCMLLSLWLRMRRGVSCFCDELMKHVRILHWKIKDFKPDSAGAVWTQPQLQAKDQMRSVTTRFDCPQHPWLDLRHEDRIVLSPQQPKKKKNKHKNKDH